MLRRIGAGVVVDPWALLSEIETVRELGVAISPETLLLADNATLILAVHRQIDKAREALRGERIEAQVPAGQAVTGDPELTGHPLGHRRSGGVEHVELLAAREPHLLLLVLGG